MKGAMWFTPSLSHRLPSANKISISLPQPLAIELLFKGYKGNNSRCYQGDAFTSLCVSSGLGF